MIEIVYKSKFLRAVGKLPENLQEEVFEKVVMFSENPQNPSLRSHKLKGTLKGYLAFSVNYRYRILFYYETPQKISLVDIGDHSIYD